MGNGLNVTQRCLNPLEPFIYICKKAQCVILYISEEQPITTCFNHQFSRSGTLNYRKIVLYNRVAFAIFDFVARLERLVEMGPRTLCFG